MPAVPFSTKTILNGLVRYIGGDAALLPRIEPPDVPVAANDYIEPFLAMEPRGLRVMRGPRSHAFINDMAPLVLAYWVGSDHEQEASQNFTWRYIHNFQILIATLGAEAEDADDLATDIDNALEAAWKNDGMYFGQKANKVAGSELLRSRWFDDPRINPQISVLIKDLRVWVRT